MIFRFCIQLFFLILTCIVLLFATSYLENKVFERSLVTTFMAYCIFISLWGMYLYKINVLRILKLIFLLFVKGLFIAFIFFFMAGVTLNTVVFTLTISAVYILLTTLFIKRFFIPEMKWIYPVILAIETIIFFCLMYLPDNITMHYYGFSIMCSLWSLSFIIPLLLNKNFKRYLSA